MLWTEVCTPLSLAFFIRTLVVMFESAILHFTLSRNDSCIEGGESIMLDMFPVVEELRTKHPEHFEVLTQIPATFQRIHYDR